MNKKKPTFLECDMATIQMFEGASIPIRTRGPRTLHSRNRIANAWLEFYHAAWYLSEAMSVGVGSTVIDEAEGSFFPLT